MKIIGKTKDGFILEAKSEEVANILGFYGPYLSGGGCPELKPGIEVEVSALYKRLYTMRKRETTLAECRKSLRSLADLLEPIDTAIQEALSEENPNGK